MKTSEFNLVNEKLMIANKWLNEAIHDLTIIHDGNEHDYCLTKQQMIDIIKEVHNQFAMSIKDSIRNVDVDSFDYEIEFETYGKTCDVSATFDETEVKEAFKECIPDLDEDEILPMIDSIISNL